MFVFSNQEVCIVFTSFFIRVNIFDSKSSSSTLWALMGSILECLYGRFYRLTSKTTAEL